MAGIVHAWEQHVLGILVLILRADYEVGVLLVGRGFLLALVHGFALAHHGAAVLAVAFKRHLRGVGLTVEQRALAILLTSQVVAQGEDILRRVLVHRRVGR